MDSRQAHLEMIQGIINRLSQNSFLLKGWSVLLLSSLFALAAFDTEPLFVYIAYFPVVAFWGLDGYFLRQERLYRRLYDRVRTIESANVDFSMDTGSVDKQVDSFLKVALSRTLLAFHGTLLFTVVLIMIIVLLLVPRGS